MRGAIPPLLQYVFMAWCLVKHRDFKTNLVSQCKGATKIEFEDRKLRRIFGPKGQERDAR
jgi:hypothetical protein